MTQSVQKRDELHVVAGVACLQRLIADHEATCSQREIRGCKLNTRGSRRTTFLSHSASETLHGAAKWAHSQSMGVIGSHPKPLTRCFDKTMGLTLWKMSGVLIITEVEIKAFVIAAKVIKECRRFLCALCKNGTACGTLSDPNKIFSFLNGPVLSLGFSTSLAHCRLVFSLLPFGPYLCASGRSDKVHHTFHELRSRTRLQQPRSKFWKLCVQAEGIPGQKCHNGHELD